MLLCRLGFHSLVIHTEPHAVACVCGILTGCVVNVGAHTCTVTCLEDGAALTSQQAVLPMGVDDIASALHLLVRRGGGAWPDAEVPAHALAALVASQCHAPSAAVPMRQDSTASDAATVVPVIAGNDGTTAVSRVRLGTAGAVAPLGLFMHTILCHRAALEARAKQSTLPADPQDTLDEVFWAESVGAVSTAPPQQNARISWLSADVGLHEAVDRCILAASASRPELRARLAAYMVVAGGGAELSGLPEALQSKLSSLWQAQQADQMAPEVMPDVHVIRARPHPRWAAWRGGALLAALDTSRDAWSRREAWRDGVLTAKAGRYDASVTPMSRLATYV